MHHSFLPLTSRKDNMSNYADLWWPPPAKAWSRAWIPNQRLGWFVEVRAPGPSIWWSVTKALALRLCRKEFPQRQKVVKQVRYLLGGKEYNKYGETHGQTQRGVPILCTHGSLDCLHGAFLPVFLWPIILVCLVYSPYLVYLRILPCMCMDLLAKMDPTKKASGKNISSHNLQGAFSMHVWPRRSLDLGNEKYVILAGPNQFSSVQFSHSVVSNS